MTKKRDLRHYRLLESTNLFIKSHDRDFPDQTIVIADQQSKGRGKSTNQWVSLNPNNLYLSILLKGSTALSQQLNHLTQFFAVIATTTLDGILSTTSQQVGIKWPNDLLIENKKVGGVLAEASYMGKKLQSVVIGIGINCELTGFDKELIKQPCTSLSNYLQFVPNKEKLAQGLTQDFFDRYEDFIEYGPSFFGDQLNKKLIHQGIEKERWDG